MKKILNSCNNIWKSFLHQFAVLNLFQTLFLISGITTIFIVSFITRDYSNTFITILAISAALFGITGTITATTRSVWNYFWGIIHVVLYGFVAFSAGFYGDVMLNWLFYFPTQIWGAMVWRRHMEDDINVYPVGLGIKGLLVLILAILVFYIPYSGLLIFLGGTSPWLDSASTTLSIIGMFLMIFRYREQWIAFWLVDIISLVMWSLAAANGVEGAAVMIVMWAFYTLSASYGIYNWYFNYDYKNLKKTEKKIKWYQVEIKEIRFYQYEKIVEISNASTAGYKRETYNKKINFNKIFKINKE